MVVVVALGWNEGQRRNIALSLSLWHEGRPGGGGGGGGGGGTRGGAVTSRRCHREVGEGGRGGVSLSQGRRRRGCKTL